jgi:hypothetical protein
MRDVRLSRRDGLTHSAGGRQVARLALPVATRVATNLVDAFSALALGASSTRRSVDLQTARSIGASIPGAAFIARRSTTRITGGHIRLTNERRARDRRRRDTVALTIARAIGDEEVRRRVTRGRLAYRLNIVLSTEALAIASAVAATRTRWIRTTRRMVRTRRLTVRDWAALALRARDIACVTRVGTIRRAANTVDAIARHALAGEGARVPGHLRCCRHVRRRWRGRDMAVRVAVTIRSTEVTVGASRRAPMAAHSVIVKRKRETSQRIRRNGDTSKLN